MKLRFALCAAAAICSAALAADVSLTDEEKQACADQGGCLFTSVAFVRARIQAAYEAGLAKGASGCKSSI